MATRAIEIFEIAMDILDESSGSDTEDYKRRTLRILNNLRHELYPYSDTYDPTDSGRAIATKIKSLDSVVDLDDNLAQGVMPHGLAAYLILDEDTAKANFLMQRYEELKMQAARGLPSVSEAIEDVCFGGSEYNEFSRW